ncbi:MAG: hypothetical protein OXF56_06480 [Rhodobacteraceae bacterium]|nr:hypothetical protein [Paracoccaceae bacterium]
MPRVFERARGHFSTFTHHGYELRLGRGTKSPRLFAVDLRNSESRELDELSDGTRAQLLLAARMAFAEEVEQGRTLPFLDEALDQSDPVRFEAIARSLGQIANDQGRQIFYIASDPPDRDPIRSALKAEDCAIATEIDLGLARKGVIGVTEPLSLQVPPQPAIPEPEGTFPEEYAVMLGEPTCKHVDRRGREYLLAQVVGVGNEDVLIPVHGVHSAIPITGRLLRKDTMEAMALVRSAHAKEVSRGMVKVKT